MKLVPHPFVERDIDGIADHIVATTGGDVAAALKRLDEIDALIASILSNPGSGRRLSGPLDGWLVRHGGRDQMITMVFRPDAERDSLFLALVAFGGRDWVTVAPARRFTERK
jgi:plasmid stabilization system protein ParE